MTEIRKRIFEQIEAERARQVAKWGDQSHKPDGTWALILGEEIGEWMRACLEGDTDHAVEEMIQCLAVGTAWLEGRMARQEESFAAHEQIADQAAIFYGGRLGFGEGERAHREKKPTTVRGQNFLVSMLDDDSFDRKPVDLGIMGLWRISDGESHVFAAYSKEDALAQYHLYAQDSGFDLADTVAVQQLPFDEPYTVDFGEIKVTHYPAEWFVLTERMRGYALVGTSCM